MQWSRDFKIYSEQLPNSTCRRTLRSDHTTICKVIADIVCTAICTNKLNPEKRAIQFMKAGTKPKKTVKTKPNILSPSIDRN